MNGIRARLKGRFGTFSLDAAFSGPAKGVTGLFGPSGCGKTTTLRCLAGLLRVADGHVSVGGEIWQGGECFVPSHKRSVGYVFQDARLFAHLSVLGNLEYALHRVPRCDRSTVTLDGIVDLMAIRPLLKRSPKGLSGGECQRIAIARALLSQPKVLLMDEPLSGLDHQGKSEILPYLESLPEALSIPIVYVSHDLAEIERLADHLVLMTKEGRVRAEGPLSSLLTDLSLPLARVAESAVVLDVIVNKYDAAYDLTACLAGDVSFLVPGRLGPVDVRRRVRVRADDVSLAKVRPVNTSVLNIVVAYVISAEQESASRMMVLLRLDGVAEETRLLSSITRKSWDELALRPGDAVFAQVKGMALAER